MVTETQVSLRQEIIRWVEEALAEGKEIAVAVERATERIVSEGYADDLIREYGPQLAREMWSSYNRSRRSNAFQQGQRRVDLEALANDDSLLDTIWPVNGHHYRLGDMDKAVCGQAQREFGKQASALASDAQFFARLQQNLKGRHLVRDSFSNEQLRSLYEQCRVQVEG